MGELPWIPLAEGLDNTGFYRWQVSFFPVGWAYRSARGRARSVLCQQVTKGMPVFSIGSAQQPRLAMSYPRADDVLSGLALVSWNSYDPEASALRAYLDVRQAGTDSWRTLAEGVPDDGVFPWDTTLAADGRYELRLTVSGGELPRPGDSVRDGDRRQSRQSRAGCRAAESHRWRTAERDARGALECLGPRMET